MPFFENKNKRLSQDFDLIAKEIKKTYNTNDLNHIDP
jgi:hypothetical protein